MKWSLLELKKYQNELIAFEQVLDLESQLMARDDQVLACEPVQVKGTLSVEPDCYIAYFQIVTTLTLPSSRSLDSVKFACDETITEIYMTKEQFSENKEFLEDKEAILVLDKDIIDLEEAVEDHVLLSIPLQVLTEDEKHGKAMPKGNDWEIISEEEYFQRKAQQSQKELDPRLAKLSALLDNDKDAD